MGGKMAAGAAKEQLLAKTLLVFRQLVGDV